MADVEITADAQAEFIETPRVIQRRIGEIIQRLYQWPQVSGARPLRGNLVGNYRIRTGDYRVVFRPSADGKKVVLWKIGYRGSVYD